MLKLIDRANVVTRDEGPKLFVSDLQCTLDVLHITTVVVVASFEESNCIPKVASRWGHTVGRRGVEWYKI